MSILKIKTSFTINLSQYWKEVETAGDWGEVVRHIGGDFDKLRSLKMSNISAEGLNFGDRVRHTSANTLVDFAGHLQMDLFQEPKLFLDWSWLSDHWRAGEITDEDTASGLFFLNLAREQVIGDSPNLILAAELQEQIALADTERRAAWRKIGNIRQPEALNEMLIRFGFGQVSNRWHNSEDYVIADEVRSAGLFLEPVYEVFSVGV